MKNQKKFPREKKRSRTQCATRIPNEYHWAILRQLVVDLTPYLTPEDITLVSTIITNRDINKYLSLSEIWGLQSITPVSGPLVTLRARLMVASLLKKFDFPGERDPRRVAAIASFYASEDRCFRFNQADWKALSIGQNKIDILFNTYIIEFVRRILGDVPNIRSMIPWMRHGPGSTYDISGIEISNYWKFRKIPYSVTEAALPHAAALVRTDERWLGVLEEQYRKTHSLPTHCILNYPKFIRSLFNVTDGSRITTVPKTAKIERTIAIEPTMNLYLQLGVDGFIRRRLRRWGIDINCQARNQELSRKGSIDDDFVTIDLSAASDSIAIKLVKQILPSAWFRYLDDLRSKFGYVDNQLIEFEKFSSMGNGYTFALETLIFSAIVFAAYKIKRKQWNANELAIYGDDIVVPKDVSELVVHGLNLCGFKINTDKSFFTGFVRESCGTDWVRGFDVRPLFFKEKPKTIKMLFNDYNRLKRHLDLWFSITDSTVCQKILTWIPKNYRKITGPYSDFEFDTYIHTNVQQTFCQYSRVWIGSRLVALPILYKRKTDFPFRKLMASLLGKQIFDSYDTNVKAGSIFDIVARNRVRYAIVPTSHTDIWYDRYNPRVIQGPSLDPWPVGLKG